MVAANKMIRRACFGTRSRPKQICELRASRNTDARVIRSGGAELTCEHSIRPQPKLGRRRTSPATCRKERQQAGTRPADPHPDLGSPGPWLRRQPTCCQARPRRSLQFDRKPKVVLTDRVIPSTGRTCRALLQPKAVRASPSAPDTEDGRRRARQASAFFCVSVPGLFATAGAAHHRPEDDGREEGDRHDLLRSAPARNRRFQPMCGHGLGDPPQRSEPAGARTV